MPAAAIARAVVAAGTAALTSHARKKAWKAMVTSEKSRHMPACVRTKRSLSPRRARTQPMRAAPTTLGTANAAKETGP